MKTTSGAHVFVIDGRAIKLAANRKVRCRLGQQAEYARALGPEVCPEVRHRVPGGYVMERLRPYPEVITSRAYINDVVKLLENHVWSQPKQDMHRTLGGGAHYGYVMDRVNEYLPHMAGKTRHLIDSLDLGLCRGCLTHGDPTLDNMMIRGDIGYGRPVIIDPLPPRFEIPEMAAVDVGKVIQSLLGYETIKYGRYRLDWTETVESRLSELWRRLDVTPREWRAATWFAYVHCVRLLPYQPEDKRPLFAALAHDAYSLAAKEQVVW